MAVQFVPGLGWMSDGQPGGIPVPGGGATVPPRNAAAVESGLGTRLSGAQDVMMISGVGQAETGTVVAPPARMPYTFTQGFVAGALVALLIAALLAPSLLGLKS